MKLFQKNSDLFLNIYISYVFNITVYKQTYVHQLIQQGSNAKKDNALLTSSFTMNLTQSIVYNLVLFLIQ